MKNVECFMANSLLYLKNVHSKYRSLIQGLIYWLNALDKILDFHSSRIFLISYVIKEKQKDFLYCKERNTWKSI